MSGLWGDFHSGVRMEMALPFASGNASRVGPIIDVDGSGAIVFVFNISAVAAGAVLLYDILADDAADMSDPAVLAGSGLIPTPVTDDDTIKWIEIQRPKHRYLRVNEVSDETNISAESCTVFIYEGRKPVIQTGFGLILLRPEQVA